MTSSLTNVVTLTRYILSHKRHTQQEQSEFAILFSQIAMACKVTANAIRRAGLEQNFGLAGYMNVQGEEVKKLDMVANSAFINALTNSDQVAVMASEEEEDAIVVEASRRGKYVVCFDPLDGSSNIDANVSIGSIFAIYKREPEEGHEADEPSVKDCLRAGRFMVASGYALYGSSTMLVCTTGYGVQGFTLDNSLGEFVLTHADVKIPERGAIYSVNEGNSIKWNEPTKRYVELVKGLTGRKPYSSRYIGSMVADVHRTILYGGIFMYPADTSSPNGKLRYLYEVAPLSYIIEQAGGIASDGRHRSLDLTPASVHQRVPCYMGSKLDVKDVERCFSEHDAEAATTASAE